MSIRTRLPVRARAWTCFMLVLFAVLPVLPRVSAAQEPELLEPEKAFRISTRALDERNVELRFEIADGYYMYRDRFKFETESGRLLADAELPPGVRKKDQFLGETETYRREVRIRVPVSSEELRHGRMKLKVTSQGCSDRGVCYVPLQQIVDVRLPGAPSDGASATLSQAASWLDDVPRALRSVTTTRDPSAAMDGTFLALLAAFFAFGLAAGFARVSSAPADRRDLPVEVNLERISLRLLTYTACGTAAGLVGAVALDRLPGALITAVLAAAFAGLAASALLVRHAATKVVTVGALLVVAKWGDALLGAAGLGLLSLAISLAPSLSGWRHAPVAARWSHALLGFAASALAVWIVSPLLAEPLRDFAWGALLVVTGIFLNAIDPLPENASAAQRLAKGIGFLALAASVIMLVFAAGGRELFAPAGPSHSRPAVVAETRFERVADLRELEARVRGATRPTMLDFYADWCVSCKEMERFTFSDLGVRDRMLKMRLLQVDVTHNTPSDKEFLRRFSLFGPPAILFFDTAGQEIRELRVIGFQSAEKFAKVLDAALREPAPAVTQGANK